MWEKEKLLVTSNLSFSHSVFKKLLLQTRKNQGLFGRGLKELEGIYNPTLRERLDKSIVSNLIGTKVKFGMGVKKKT